MNGYRLPWKETAPGRWEAQGHRRGQVYHVYFESFLGAWVATAAWHFLRERIEGREAPGHVRRFPDAKAAVMACEELERRLRTAGKEKVAR